MTPVLPYSSEAYKETRGLTRDADFALALILSGSGSSSETVFFVDSFSVRIKST